MNPSFELSLIRSRFAKRFVKALLKINADRQNPISESFSSSPGEILRRRRRIRLAADRSMARAVRSRRIWRRAVLRRTGNCRARALARRLMIKQHHDEYLKVDGAGAVEREAEELRKVVPGGEDMSVRRLVDEAAHYAECLTVQVQVMTTILHYVCSNI